MNCPPRKLDSLKSAGSRPHPIVKRTQATKLDLDTLPIVIVNILFQTRAQRIDVCEFVQMEALGLQRAKETFHHRIVEAISLPRHALRDTPPCQLSLVQGHSIVPTLVRMQKWLGRLPACFHCLFKHTHDHREVRPNARLIGHNLTIVEFRTGERYYFLPPTLNSVTSVTHFSSGRVAVKSRLRTFGAALPYSPLYDRYLFFRILDFIASSFISRCTFL